MRPARSRSGSGRAGSTASSRSRSTRRSRTTARRSTSRRSASTRRSTAGTSTSRSRAPSPGLGAIEDCIAAGALDQRDADLLARALRRGRRGVPARARAARRRRAAIPARCCSVASFFVSRVDTEADRRLDEVGRPELKGQLASRTRSSPTATGRRRSRATAGRPSRQRAPGRNAASGRRPRRRTPTTATCIYVEELIGPDVVNTMPAETIRAFQDHGEVRDTLETGLDEARALLDELADGRASTTTTSSRRSSGRACRSSPTRSRSCSTGIEAKAARSRSLTQPACSGRDADEPARGRSRGPAQAGSLRARDLRRLGRPHAAQALPGAVRARLPPPAARAVRGRRRRAHRADDGPVRAPR